MVIRGVDKQFHQRMEAKRPRNQNSHNFISAEPVQLQIKRCKNGTSTSSSQNRLKLRNLAEECERFSISHRSAAYLAIALLKDIGNISEYNQWNIIDRSQMRRERMKQRI